MYLAQEKIEQRNHYFIRESYQDQGVMRSRNLLNLGTDPARYIVYPGGKAYYIDEHILEVLHEQGVTADHEELERIFWPFLKPSIKRALERFAPGDFKIAPLDAEEMAALRTSVHLFDKRRFHYLKYGQMDQRQIRRVPLRYFRVFLGRSRDEIEQLFMRLERQLRPGEWKRYIYAIFDLRKFFPEPWAPVLPLGLDQEKVDEYFLEEICRLHRDRAFWAGLRQGPSPHSYLVRYVVMFFDSDYGPGSSFAEYLRDYFMNSRRHLRPPPGWSALKNGEAGTIFGVDEKLLRKMSKRELTRLFRKKAKELHPDRGGDHERFIRLSEAYAELLRRR